MLDCVLRGRAEDDHMPTKGLLGRVGGCE